MCESFEQDKLMFKMMMDFPVITLQNAFYLSLIGKKCGSKKTSCNNHNEGHIFTLPRAKN